MIPRLVIIRGAGDLATGVACRLWQAGFNPVMLEHEKPLVVRRTVSFASAVFNGQITVESIKAVYCPSPEQVPGFLADSLVPVLIDPKGLSLSILKPSIVIDATMIKMNTITAISDAPFVIGLGPGFSAGIDVHAVVETQRGHFLGKLLYKGSAAADTSEPAPIAGYGKERILRSPEAGLFEPLKEIGDLVQAGEPVAFVDGTEIRAPIDGLVRGMLYPELKVTKGMKVGDIDPRGRSVDYHSISDKARSVGGGVLEAIMHRYFFADR
jgi:xanthine dehydrogenase accessory factor